MQWLAEDALKSGKDQFIKLCRLTSEAIREGAKIISKTPYLVWWKVLSKNQRVLSEKKLQKCLKYHPGCIVWRSTPQNVLTISLPNLVG